MQSYGFKNAELTNANVCGQKMKKPQLNGCIKKKTKKNNYSEGGMKVTDVESPDRSLKLKQFKRAHLSYHVTSKIQASISSKLDEKKFYSKNIQQ
jgi:hypothetical protein